MRRFVPDGPELPYELLQAHEEQRLVFFCGAGISVYTGLPDFKELVSRVYSDLGVPLSEDGVTETNKAFEKELFDQALHLLEKKVGNRSVVRKRIIEILSKPPKRGSGTVRLHEALLQLAATDDGGCRIVTTNFDDRFHIAGGKHLPIAEAPRLGWPRPESWRHLTYLHGRINKSDPDGEDIVLTSGDFGRAYLTEGWASNFLTELFRNFTVLFVGYSLNDPVLRYIADAIATGANNNQFRPRFVLADYQNGQKNNAKETWEAKSVVPITFSTGPEGKDFSLLEKTLKIWAERHRGGLNSRISVASDIARKPHIKSSNDDDVENLAWALSKSDGSVAAAFADINPPPDISWLEPLSKYKMPTEKMKEEVSLFALPSPPGETNTPDRKEKHHLAPLTGYGASGIDELPISQVTFHLGRWLTNHLDKQELVDWVTANQGIVHPSWCREISNELDTLAEPWKSYWRIVTMGRTIPLDSSIVWPLRKILQEDHWSSDSRGALLALTSGWAVPQSPFRSEPLSETPSRLSDIARFELRIPEPYMVQDFLEHSEKQEIRAGLAEISDDLTSNLKNLLVIAKETESWDAIIHTQFEVPDVADQPKELADEGWAVVLRIARVAFDCLLESNPAAASVLAAWWREIYRKENFILFGRLSVYASTEMKPSSSQEIVDFLLEKNSTILWDDDAQPEIYKFLRTQLNNLGKSDQKRLIATIKKGPERSVFPNFFGSDKDFKDRIAHYHCGHIIKIAESGANMPSAVQRLAEKYRKEGVSEEVERERHSEVEVSFVPRSKADDLLRKSPEEIVNHLLKKRNRIHERNRRAHGEQLADLIEKDTDKGLSVIRILSGMECEEYVWAVGLSGLEKTQLSERKAILNALIEINETRSDWLNSEDVQRPLSDYLKKISSGLPADLEPKFMKMWDVLWQKAENAADAFAVPLNDALTDAINSPSGILAESLLYRFFAHKPKTGSGLRGEFLNRINKMWDGEVSANYFARIICASRLLSLHQIDPEWAKKRIIQKIEDSDERLNFMQAFLWPAKWDVEVVKDMEGALNACLPVINKGQDRLGARFSEFFGSILVQAPDALSYKTKRAFFEHATVEQLGALAWTFGRFLKNSKDRSANLWQDRIGPIFDKFWPGDRDRKTEELSARLFQLALSTQEAFPQAVKTLDKKGLLIEGSAKSALWNLREIDDGEYDIARQHPAELLDLLRRTVNENHPGHGLGDLSKVLDRIAQSAPKLGRSRKFERLSEIAARG